MTTRAEVLVEGAGGRGDALVFTAPISFWGGVNPKSGQVADVRHPQHGLNIAGRVVFLPGTIGSSSAAAILLELVHAGRAPAAIVLHEPDAILLLGLIVAKEMGYDTPVAVQLHRREFEAFDGRPVSVSEAGEIRITNYE